MNLDRRAEDFLSELSNAVRENPISAALIGMGLVWMVAGGASAGRVGSLFGKIPDAARDTMDAASDSLRLTMDRASSGVSRAGDTLTSATSAAYSQAADMGSKIAGSASERLGALPDLGADMMSSARSNLSDLFEAQPLALGVIGLGIGASIAAALPTTDLEETYFGETSERFVSQSTEFVGEKLDQAVQTAENVVDAMASEAKKQGLTADGLRSAAEDVSQKVSRVADSAMSSGQNNTPGSSGQNDKPGSSGQNNKPGPSGQNNKAGQNNNAGGKA